MLLMLQREAVLVEEMRGAAAEFRRRFDEPLRVMQASRDDFHRISAALLPPCITESLPHPPSFVLSVQGLSPDTCANFK